MQDVAKRILQRLKDIAQRRKRFLFVAIAIAIILVVGLVWLRNYINSPGPDEMVTVSSNSPSEEETSPGPRYYAPEHPKRLVMPSIGVENYIQRVGLDQYGSVASPTNIHYAGWFANKPKPGDKGVALIVGHVQGWRAEGVFKNLGDLGNGDRFTVEFADRSRKEFEVVSVNSYSSDEVAKRLFAKDEAIERQLNLTDYDIQAGGNSERVFVVSRQVD